MQTHPSLTLDRYLSERGPVEPVQAAKIAIQVARQLDAAGDALLVHPGRILVGKDGAIRLLPPQAEDLALPAIVEFPAYASPEEARGAHPDIRAGLYSLGCTLHEILTGRPPYAAADPKQLLRAHIETPVPDPRKLSPRTPAAIAEIVKELLAKDPEHRIQTSEELVRRLRQAIGAPAAPSSEKPKAVSRPAASPAAAAAPPRPAGAPAPAPRSRMRAARAGAAARGSRPAGRAGSARGGHAAARGTGRPAGASGHLDLEEGDDDEPVSVEPRKRTYAFTIVGTVIGLLLGGLIVARTMQEKEPELDRTSIVEEEKARVLAERKKRFLDQQSLIQQRIQATLAEARKRQPEDRREYLSRVIEAEVDTRWGHLLTAELLKLGPPPARKVNAKEDAEIDAEYAAQKAEALKIYSEGRIGDAIEEMMKNYSKFKARHDAEITDYVEKRWSAEITKRWEETKKEVEKLDLEGKVELAIEALEKAKVYGDNGIRKEADGLIEEHKARSSLIEENKLKVMKQREKSLEEAPDVKEDPGTDDEEKPDL